MKIANPPFAPPWLLQAALVKGGLGGFEAIL